MVNGNTFFIEGRCGVCWLELPSDKPTVSKASPIDLDACLWVRTSEQKSS